MKKHLFVFSDGTWNTPEQDAQTNVFRLSQMISHRAPDGSPQLVFYDPGVGSEGGTVERMLGGATGLGIDLNIQQLYSFLAMNYEDGDSIYLCGFSRGAYTVRSLSGMIHEAGLLYRDKMSELKEAYDLYRDNANPESDVAKAFRAKNSRRVPIKLLLCFDTVGSLGLPVDSIPGGGFLLNTKKYAFHDTTVGEYVEHAIHVLSIDEDRKGFFPTYMDAHPERGPEHVTEVYMPGYHSGVGGGNLSEINLSDNALRFVIMEMKRRGLNIGIREDMIPEEKDPCVQPPDVGFMYHVLKVLAGKKDREIKSIEMLHESAIKRYCLVEKWRPGAMEKLKAIEEFVSRSAKYIKEGSD